MPYVPNVETNCLVSRLSNFNGHAPLPRSYYLTRTLHHPLLCDGDAQMPALFYYITYLKIESGSDDVHMHLHENHASTKTKKKKKLKIKKRHKNTETQKHKNENNTQNLKTREGNRSVSDFSDETIWLVELLSRMPRPKQEKKDPRHFTAFHGILRFRALLGAFQGNTR